MYYLTIEDFKILTASEIFNKMISIQGDMMSEIVNLYTLTELERGMLEEYRRIIYISFYPNVMLCIYLIDKCDMADKVVDLLNIILEVL